MALRSLSLCSGIGGLDLGLAEWCRTVAYVERDPYAAAVLVARMEDEALDPAPVWDDLKAFDGRAWRGAVDLVCAGFPCQPVSVAGKRLAQDDPRWLWPHIARILREVEPRLVFLENVPGLLGAGLGDVLGDLAALGFDAEWSCLRASDVGASHRRRRVFILAYRDEHGSEGERRGGILDGLGAPLRDDPDRRDPSVADAEGEQRGCRPGRSGDRQEPQAHGGNMGHPEGARLEADGRTRPAALPGPYPPGPDGDWSSVPEDLWPVEPALRRDPDGASTRVERLRCLGNGVVPAQAAEAFRGLLRRVLT